MTKPNCVCGVVCNSEHQIMNHRRRRSGTTMHCMALPSMRANTLAGQIKSWSGTGVGLDERLSKLAALRPWKKEEPS